MEEWIMHFLIKDQVEGIETIRAFGWGKEIENANISSLDKFQRPYYMLFCLQR